MAQHQHKHATVLRRRMAKTKCTSMEAQKSPPNEHGTTGLTTTIAVRSLRPIVSNHYSLHNHLNRSSEPSELVSPLRSVCGTYEAINHALFDCTSYTDVASEESWRLNVINNKKHLNNNIRSQPFRQYVDAGMYLGAHRGTIANQQKTNRNAKERF